MKIFQPLIYALLICFGIVIGSINNQSKIINLSNTKINGIINLINNHYVDTIETTNFEENTINAILNKLDPHSEYIPLKNTKGIEEDMKGSFSGIGVQFNIINDTIVVISAISGGPSEKLGIQSGDRIIKIEKKDVANIGIKNKDVIESLRGEKGTIVNITIKRNNNEFLEFAITRDKIPLYSVDVGIILHDDIGYIKINRFSATTYEEMMSKISTLKDRGMKSLILDLRGNPGGYLHVANQICDEFLKENELIVFTEGRNRAKKEFFATKKGTLEKIKVSVIIDEGSASASEIVAGAIQDNDRGIIIGRRSFGKGLVQEQIPMEDGSLLRLTTQRYYTPSGRCIQKDYGDNKKEYFLEKYQREEDFIDSNKLIYTTKIGRKVYGGGGIYPDIIVKRDTSLNYYQINYMISKGWINEYSIKKSKNFSNQEIKNFKQINIDHIYLDFIKFVNQKDPSFELQLGQIELNYFKNLILATISRNIWNNDIYYMIITQEDEFVQKALTELNN